VIALFIGTALQNLNLDENKEEKKLANLQESEKQNKIVQMA